MRASAGHRAVLARTTRLATLALVLLLCVLLVPDSAVRSTEVALVRITRAQGVDVGEDVIWILAVGSDARPGEQMTKTRADAIQLVGMNTRTGAATAFGVPRDSYVSIPGVGSDRINAAMVYGGPPALADTIASLFGIRPDYVLVTRFKFFEEMVRDIGGIWVDNPRAFSDPYLEPRGFESGRIPLSGYDAMAFSRIRKSLLGGDFDRSANQQRVLRGIQEQVALRFRTPGFVERGVLSVMAHTDTDLSPTELFRIAQAVAQVDPHLVTTCVLRGGLGSVGSASVVFPDLALARRWGSQAGKDARLESCG